MESETMIDLKPLWDNFSTQAIILLSIVAVCLIIGAIATQGFARAIFAVAAVFVLIMFILILGNATAVGEWLMKLVFKLNADSGVHYYGIQLH